MLPLPPQATGLTASGQSTTITVTLRTSDPNCDTPAEFLYNSQFFYAAFGDGAAGRLDACCGTMTL